MLRLQSILVIIMSITIGTAIAHFANEGAAAYQGYPSLMLCAVLAFGIQWVAYIPAAIMQTERFYDLVGGSTYIILVIFAYAAGPNDLTGNIRGVVLLVMVSIWATRLAIFLAHRIHRAGRDSRFDTIKIQPLRFAMAWTVQGLWVFLTVLPVLIILTGPSATTPIGITDGIGWSLWLVGFVIEVTADAQKSRFKRDAKNQERWIDSGLWAFSQHPNYFGEILLWSGIFLSGFSLYQGGQWLAALSPVFVYLLLTRVSGIPMLDKKSDDRWGEDPAYRKYRAETNVLVPGPRRPSN